MASLRWVGRWSGVSGVGVAADPVPISALHGCLGPKGESWKQTQAGCWCAWLRAGEIFPPSTYIDRTSLLYFILLRSKFHMWSRPWISMYIDNASVHVHGWESSSFILECGWSALWSDTNLGSKSLRTQVGFYIIIYRTQVGFYI